jgi:hypothetical protein
MSQLFEIRKRPKKGTVLRVRLGDGYYYYACQATSITLWLYRFRTLMPAQGSAFFDRAYWKWGLRVGDLSASFVNCGFIKLDGPEYIYTPVFYKEIPEYEAAHLGYQNNTVVCKSWNTLETREVTPEEIREKGYGRDQWMESRYEEFISQYIPQMELREVPPKFVDRRDSASLVKAAKKPTVLTIRVTLRELDLATDDIEPDIEEPLQEAVEDAECGTWASSGTAPGGLFDIDFETAPSTRAKCLKVIERTLKKLGCPESTTIEVIEEPYLDRN